MKFVFGPVPSRRLGFSLGVDVIPMKTCNLNCIYCELGRTSKDTMERKEYIPTREILAEVREAIRTTDKIDYITFSGSGEPTLNNKLGEMIREIKLLTSIPVAVLTNGTLLYLPEVRKALLPADLVLPSLDAVSPEVIRRINRPYGRLQLEKIVEGLIQFRREFRGQIWLEILFVQGVNDSEDEISKLREAIHRIHPDRVQLNTVVRPGAEAYARPLSREQLEKIRLQFGKKAEVIAQFHPDAMMSTCENGSTAILSLAARRPVTLEDICGSLGCSPEVARAQIQKLMEEGKLRERRYGDDSFYIVDQKVAKKLFDPSI